MHAEIQHKINKVFQPSYFKATGNHFDHFFCPIMLKEVEAPLCRGHVIPEKAGVSSKWVPQVEAVDNKFGELFESRLGSLSSRDLPIYELLVDKKLNKTWQPKLEFNGSSIAYYSTPGIKRVEGHTPVIVETPKGNNCYFNMKLDASQFTDGPVQNLDFVLECDLRAELAAASLKAAHLTMFYLLQYQYVFSIAGEFTAGLLSDLYHSYIETNDCEQVLSAFFNAYPNIVRPRVFDSPQNVEPSLESGLEPIRKPSLKR